MRSEIDKLREKLEIHQLDGLIVPSNDEFQSEYVPDYNNYLKILTGFTGSNGVVLILKDETIFFTDGRYLLQAKQELSNDFKIHNILQLYHNQFMNGKIGYDPKLHTWEEISKYKNSVLVAVEDLVEMRSIAPVSEIFNYPLKYAGQSSASKINQLNDFLIKNDLDALVITDPTNICWLLNIRAHDVAYNPILLSFAIYHLGGEIELFSNALCTKKLTDFSVSLKKIANKRVQLDPSSASSWVSAHFKKPIFLSDPCVLAKACKNRIEINQARRIHIIDGIALTKLLYWLETNYKKFNISEINVVEKLFKFRSESLDFIYPSFATIAGFSSNGAIIHYNPQEKTDKVLTGNGLFLLDSGGQYFGGTTDITRVVPIGKSSYEQKLNFTLVLKGHIALATAKFPEGTRGADLDVLARQFLWQHGKDYPHGTGHGVGSCLSVHEGPQRISKFSSCPLKPGMIISNEPGYYKDNEYGIRIENLMLVIKLKDGYLGFETLSLAPINTKLILKSLLTEVEIKWLYSYHQMVFKKLSPYLTKREASWIIRHCI